MSFEISGMTDARMQSWATKCDANSDGIISDTELNIFEEGKKTMHTEGDYKKDRVIVGGVALWVDELKTIKYTSDAKTDDYKDYAVEFNSGIKAKFDRQDGDNQAFINSREIKLDRTEINKGITDTFTQADNFVSGSGISIEGGVKDDRIEVENSKIDYIDAKRGWDYTSIRDSVGLAGASVISDRGEITNSENLRIRRDQIFRLRPDSIDKIYHEEKIVNEENPNLKW